jgi:WD40 repeat protein
MELRTNPQSLKGDLDTIILKSLAKDATERYQTVGELTADIIRYLNDLPILAQKPSKIYQFKKFVRRNKVAFYGACVIGLLLISLLGTAIYSARVSARQARENLRQAYSSDMNLAMESYETANLVRLHQILEKYKDVDFRGWEYDFLQNLANPKGRISTFGHSAEVWNVAFSPDSRKLATACGDGFARIYEVPGGRLLTQTAVQEKNIWRVRFSPDGKFLATASGDSASSSVKIWNSETGAEVRALVGHTARVRAIDFSPDGKTIATGSQDGTVRIWNTETGAELKQFTFKSEIRQLETQDLRFSRDGTKLLSATNDYALMTEIASGKTLFKIDDLPAWISIALSPDGSRFAFGATTTQIRIYETNTGKMLSEIKEHTGKINNLAFSPDGKFLLSASSDRTIRFFETDSGTEVQNLRVHFADAWSVDFSADGKFIATAGTDFKAFLFDAKILQNSSSFAYRVGGGGGWSAISADRKTVAMPSYLNVGVDQTVWDIETKSQKFVLLSGIDFDSAAFSPDGAILATGRRNGNITYWNMATGAEIRSFPAHDNPELKVIISHLAYSPDGKRLVSGGQDNLVKIWNAETDELIRELWRFESKVSALGISPDGKRIFAASYDLSAKLFDAETGEISFDTGKQTKAILSVAFAPDGKTFATGGADSVIKIWQTADGKLLETITGNAGFTQALTFTPDGTRLVSASGDGVIRLWDMETKAQVLAIRTNSSITDFLAFTPDGKTLISHGTEEKVHLWESFSEF